MALPICTAPPLTVSDSPVSSSRGERRPVDAVAAGAAADGDDQVARLDLLLERRPRGIRPTVPQKTSGLAEVALVEAGPRR